MNCIATYLIAISISYQCVAGEAPRESRYLAYHEYGGRSEQIVKRLEGLKAKDLKIEDLTLSEAMNRLQKACAPEGGPAVINFVIRKPRVQGGGDAKSKPPELKVTLQAETIDFAAAVDRICQQVGYMWSIGVQQGTGAPVLIVHRPEANKAE